MGSITDQALVRPLPPYGGPARDGYFGTVFGTPDFTNGEKRLTRCMQFGGQIGVSAGLVSAVLLEGADPLNLRWDNKRFILWRILKFGTLGVSAGALYVAGVTAANKLRGQDGPLNHFIGGFGISTVHSYMRGGSLPTFFVGGLYYGLVAAGIKHAYMLNWTFNNIVDDKAHVVSHARYPDMYAAVVSTRDLPKEES